MDQIKSLCIGLYYTEWANILYRYCSAGDSIPQQCSG